MKEIKLEDFLGFNFISDVAYAPDGKAAAFVVTYPVEEENNYEGHIYVVEDDKVRRLTGLGKERSFIWEDNTHILFKANRTEKEQKRIKDKEAFTSYYRIDIHGGEAQHAFTIEAGVSLVKIITDQLYIVRGEIDVDYPDIYKMTEEERKELKKHYEEEADYQVVDETPYWTNGGTYTNKKRNALFTYDVKTAQIERITQPLFDTSAMEVFKGKVYYAGSAFTCRINLWGQLYEYDPKTKETKCLYEKGEFQFGGLLPLEDKLLILASQAKRFGLNENPYIYEYNFEEEEVVLFAQNENSMWGSVGTDARMGGGFSVREGMGRLYFITTRRNSAVVYTLNQQGEIEPWYEKEGSVDCLDVNKMNGDVLYVGMHDMKLQELYRRNQSGEVVQLTQLNEEVLKDKYIAMPEKISVVSQEVDIDGWVLKPINYDENQSYPAVFDIHGGPKTVYGEVYYHEMQLWANQGYFVFFCNPTGSDGRGNEFADIRGKYGTIDYRNLMDFADEVLKKYPQIDANRIGETGGSYGGFMSNWIAGHTNRFACIATQRCISDWISFYGISDIGTYFATDQTGGDIFEEESVEQLWRLSPLKYVKDVTTPMLFIHSDEDYRCPISQAREFYSAVAMNGIEARMCVFKGENHELSRGGKPKHRVRRLAEITKWMDRFLK